MILLELPPEVEEFGFIIMILLELSCLSSLGPSCGQGTWLIYTDLTWDPSWGQIPWLINHDLDWAPYLGQRTWLNNHNITWAPSLGPGTSLNNHDLTWASSSGQGTWLNYHDLTWAPSSGQGTWQGCALVASVGPPALVLAGCTPAKLGVSSILSPLMLRC